MNYKNIVTSISPVCCRCKKKATSVLPAFPKYRYNKEGKMIGGVYSFDSYCDKHRFGRHMPIGLVVSLNLESN